MTNRVVLILLALTVGVQMLILYRSQSAAPLASVALDAIETISGRALTVSVKDAPRLGDNDA